MKILGILFLCIISLLIIFIAASHYAKNDADEAMTNIITDDVFGKWDYNALIDNSSSDLINKMKENKAYEMFDYFKDTYGNFISKQEPYLTGGYKFYFGEQYSGLYATITYNSIYEKSEAKIDVMLVKEFSRWKIDSFLVTSPMSYDNKQ